MCMCSNVYTALLSRSILMGGNMRQYFLQRGDTAMLNIASGTHMDDHAEAEEHIRRLAPLLRHQATSFKRHYSQDGTYTWTHAPNGNHPRFIGDLRDDLLALSRTLRALLDNMQIRFGAAWWTTSTLMLLDNKINAWLLPPDPELGPLRSGTAKELYPLVETTIVVANRSKQDPEDVPLP